VTETTVIRRGHEPLALSEILPGDVVEARGIEVSPGVIEADKIQVESPELEEAEVVGVVQSVGDASLVIETETDGVLTVNVTDRTRIKRRGNPIALSDIFPGDLVEVGGVWVDASTILASAIAVEVQEMEIEGTVDSIEGDAFVVSTAEGPITVVVTSATRFKRGSANVSLTDLVVGDLVEVKGFRIDDTTIEAHRVSIEESEDEGDDEGEGDEEEPEAVEVDGTILEIGDAAFAIETDEGVVTVQVNAETQFELGEDVILYADLRVGDEVEVEGFWISDTAIDAVRVSAEIAD
ncbi:MAG TPA: DUF5666 domain-containing protein, partial [Thermoanaerobaculia bacterium]|nr:DUF5666 domain-containing protein [Thermoanaerobaculia bacterium]